MQCLCIGYELVNIQIDSGRATTELGLLDEVYRAVRDDGSGEDDVILLGSFAVDAGWTANVCFGGENRDILFITAKDSIYTLQMQVQGAQIF